MAAGRVRRGEVYSADLRGVGGRLFKDRPVVVVQNDVGNLHSPETIVAAIRDPHGGRLLPIFVPLSAGAGGLAKGCVIDTGHLHTIDQDSLGPKGGALSKSEMDALDRALRISLGLI